jgi:hypothetical protein
MDLKTNSLSRSSPSKGALYTQSYLVNWTVFQLTPAIQNMIGNLWRSSPASRIQLESRYMSLISNYISQRTDKLSEYMWNTGLNLIPHQKCNLVNNELIRHNTEHGTNEHIFHTFQNLMVLSFVERRKRAPLAIWHHLILLIFSSISKLLR